MASIALYLLPTKIDIHDQNWNEDNEMLTCKAKLLIISAPVHSTYHKYTCMQAELILN